MCPSAHEYFHVCLALYSRAHAPKSACNCSALFFVEWSRHFHVVDGLIPWFSLHKVWPRRPIALTGRPTTRCPTFPQRPFLSHDDAYRLYPPRHLRYQDLSRQIHCHPYPAGRAASFSFCCLRQEYLSKRMTALRPHLHAVAVYLLFSLSRFLSPLLPPPPPSPQRSTVPASVFKRAPCNASFCVLRTTRIGTLHRSAGESRGAHPSISNDGSGTRGREATTMEKTREIFQRALKRKGCHLPHSDPRQCTPSCSPAKRCASECGTLRFVRFIEVALDTSTRMGAALRSMDSIHSFTVKCASIVSVKDNHDRRTCGVSCCHFDVASCSGQIPVLTRYTFSQARRTCGRS